MPVEVGEILKESFAVQVRGACRVVYGDGTYLRLATDHVMERLIDKLKADPTYNEARICIYGVEGAKRIFERSFEAKNEAELDSCIRLAFNRLFDAARIAAMAYIATEETRWGKLKCMLPAPHEERFKDIIDKLHIQFFYLGNYPTENIEEEFERWLRIIEEFIHSLEAESKPSNS